MKFRHVILFVFVLALAMLSGTTAYATAAETATAVANATRTAVSIKQTQTAEAYFTRTFTPTATKTITKTITPTITRTFTATKTFTKTPFNTLTITRTITATVTQTITKTITATATKTVTKTITPTSTITKTITPTFTITQTVTSSPTATPTITATATTIIITDTTGLISKSEGAVYRGYFRTAAGTASDIDIITPKYYSVLTGEKEFRMTYRANYLGSGWLVFYYQGTTGTAGRSIAVKNNSFLNAAPTPGVRVDEDSNTLTTGTEINTVYIPANIPMTSNEYVIPARTRVWFKFTSIADNNAGSFWVSGYEE